MIMDRLSEELPFEQKPEEGGDTAMMSRAAILNSG